MVERLFLAVPWGCLRFVIVVFPDHTHILFLMLSNKSFMKIKNRIGPKTDPWGTPDNTGTGCGISCHTSFVDH